MNENKPKPLPEDTPLTVTWALVHPGRYARPDLYWNAADNEWAEGPDEATEYDLAERGKLDLTAFGGGVEWWQHTSS